MRRSISASGGASRDRKRPRIVEADAPRRPGHEHHFPLDTKNCLMPYCNILTLWLDGGRASATESPITGPLTETRVIELAVGPVLTAASAAKAPRAIAGSS
jgi:hypothetical protein